VNKNSNEDNKASLTFTTSNVHQASPPVPDYDATVKIEATEEVDVNNLIVNGTAVYGYDVCHDLLVVCKVDHETLHTTFFDESVQFKKLFTLPPVKVVQPEGWKTANCKKVYVKLGTTSLYVHLKLVDVNKRGKRKQIHLYAINLTGEQEGKLKLL